jgi:Ras-related protein Rab-7A
LVYDVNNNKSYESLGQWHDEFLVQASPRDPENVPFVVLGTRLILLSRKGWQDFIFILNLHDIHVTLFTNVTQKRAMAFCQAKGNLPYV